MGRRAALTLLVLIICGCSTTTATLEPTNTIPPTETPLPTQPPTATPEPTATPVPLADIDLEPLLVQPGDLPPGYAGSQIRVELPDFALRGPEPVNHVRQILSKNGDVGGNVAIVLYESLEDVQEAFVLAAENLPNAAAVDDFTEDGSLGSFAVLNLSAASFAFSRCHAVVSGQLLGTTDVGAALSYAKRLEARLQPYVCIDGEASPVE